MRKLLITCLFLAMVFTWSCRKSGPVMSPPTVAQPGPYSSLDTIYKMLAVKPRLFTFDAGLGSSFWGASGTMYYFPPGCFQYANGTTVTGDVLIEYAEYLKKGDMIFSKILPVSNEVSIITGGELYVMATQNGEKIFLKPGISFTATIPKGRFNDTVLSLYTGEVVTNSTSNSLVNWMRSEDSMHPQDIIYNADNIVINSGSLGYCNAASPKPTYNYYNLYLEFFKDYEPSTFPELYCYVSNDGYNYVNVSTQHNPASRTLELYLPSTSVTIVVFAISNGRFYAGTSGAWVYTNGTGQRIFLKETDPFVFKNQIDSL